MDYFWADSKPEREKKVHRRPPTSMDVQEHPHLPVRLQGITCKRGQDLARILSRSSHPVR